MSKCAMLSAISEQCIAVLSVFRVLGGAGVLKGKGRKADGSPEASAQCRR